MKDNTVTRLSRSIVVRGLKGAQELQLIEYEPGRTGSPITLIRHNTESAGGWAKLPTKQAATLIPRIPHRGEIGLTALKIYMTLIAARPNENSVVRLAHTIAGEDRLQVWGCSAITLLANAGLLHVVRDDGGDGFSDGVGERGVADGGVPLIDRAGSWLVTRVERRWYQIFGCPQDSSLESWLCVLVCKCGLPAPPRLANDNLADRGFDYDLDRHRPNDTPGLGRQLDPDLLRDGTRGRGSDDAHGSAPSLYVRLITILPGVPPRRRASSRATSDSRRVTASSTARLSSAPTRLAGTVLPFNLKVSLAMYAHPFGG